METTFKDCGERERERNLPSAVMPSIRDEVAFDRRTQEAHRIRAKYPNRIPVICEKAPRSDLPEIDKKKFLVPMNMLVGEFKYIIHKHINQCAQLHGMALTHEKTIYLFVNNTAPKAGALIQEVYEAHMADDGFLYIEYSCENTLGVGPPRRKSPSLRKQDEAKQEKDDSRKSCRKQTMAIDCWQRGRNGVRTSSRGDIDLCECESI